MALAFGTSGIRGLATDLSDEVCENYARAFVRHCRQVLNGVPSQMIIAGDLRDSTPRIVAAVEAGLHKEGVTVLKGGIVPTPALAYGCQMMNCPGIMVTGSHIPGDRNGLKFYFPQGEILKKDEAPILSEYALLSKRGGAGLSGKSETIDLEAAFISRYIDYFGPGLLNGMKIVLYEHSSAAREVIRKILESLGATVFCYGRSENFIPIDTEALTGVDEFRSVILEKGAAAFVSTDGDGDRPMILDEQGKVVRGDQIGVIAALALGADAVVTPVSSSTALERTKAFRSVRRCKIGSPFVAEEMMGYARDGAIRVFGYEANGGLLLGSDLVDGVKKPLSALMTRDSVLPIVLLLKAAVSSKKTISAVVADLPQRFTSSEVIREFPIEKSSALVRDFSQGGAAFFTGVWGKKLGDATRIDQTDGVRVEFAKDVILHFRPSGNAPEFRIYAEAGTSELAEKWVQAAKEWVGGLSA